VSNRSFDSVKAEDLPETKTLPKFPIVEFRKQPTLHVFDASNWVCRAYFVSQLQKKILTAPDGTPTGAVYIFMNMVEAMLNQIRKDPKGAYMAWCFDGRAHQTWRYRAIQQWASDKDKKYLEAVFPKKTSGDYKGTRDRSKTADLPIQLDLAQEILQAYGIWAERKSPYEADDIAGTLAHRFSKQKVFVDLYTRDKDYLQLVINKMVRIIMAAQANAPEKRYTHKNVHEHFGIPFGNIVDYLAMCGDSTDNIPGLPGVGEGTAVSLIKEYGSLENLVAAAKTIKSGARWKKALTGDYPCMDLGLQKELVTIDLNVPRLPKNLSAFEIKSPDMKAIKDIKKRLKFKRIFDI